MADVQQQEQVLGSGASSRGFSNRNSHWQHCSLEARCPSQRLGPVASLLTSGSGSRDPTQRWAGRSLPVTGSPAPNSQASSPHRTTPPNTTTIITIVSSQQPAAPPLPRLRAPLHAYLAHFHCPIGAASSIHPSVQLTSPAAHPLTSSPPRRMSALAGLLAHCI